MGFEIDLLKAYPIKLRKGRVHDSGSAGFPSIQISGGTVNVYLCNNPSVAKFDTFANETAVQAVAELTSNGSGLSGVLEFDVTGDYLIFVSASGSPSLYDGGVLIDG